MSPPFLAKDCNLSLLATGVVAETLIELRDQIRVIPINSIYYHFWGHRLRLSAVQPEYHNDFARYAHFSLKDEILSERLSVIDPTDYPNLEDLRRKVLEVMDDRLDEVGYILWAPNMQRFHFLNSIMVIYNLGLKAEVPMDLKKISPLFTLTSLYYHFIDARRRTEKGTDDFTFWLSSFGTQYEGLIQKIKMIDPYFLSLSEIKQKLIELFNREL